MFQKRLEEKKPIYLHEFLYPLAQAYDSVAMDVDLELGGNDQTFNMLCGRDLMRALKNKEKFVLTLKLLTDPEGKKMGKSEGNMINLDETPDQMFGKVMSWPDELIVPGLELLTEVLPQEIAKIENGIKSGKINPKEAKIRLAKEIISLCHDKNSAEAAEKEFEKIFKKKETPSEIEVVSFSEGKINIIDLLTGTAMAQSNSQAKRLIIQGSFKIDGVAEKDWKKIVDVKKGQVLQEGKRKFKKII